MKTCRAPLCALSIVQVPYAGRRRVADTHWAFAEYAASGAYERAAVPLSLSRPEASFDPMSTDEPRALGLIGGSIADVVARARNQGQAVLMVGGNCHHATGVLGGLQEAHGAGARIGLVWFDAHGDFNTPQTTISGSLGGMSVAVCTGLAFPSWREGSLISAPVPIDRLLMTDLRNLDPAEADLVRATGVTVAAPAAGFPGCDLEQAVADLADCVDMIYLHVDHDILDAAHTPNHVTKEPNGPNLGQVLAAIDTVMATGKVVAYALVSVFPAGDGGEVSVASGIELIGGGLASWHTHGMPRV